jgi:TonB family protein
MSEPVNTPEPPYYAVIFTSVRTNVDSGYGEMAERMLELALIQPGFLGFETSRQVIGISVSYWSTLDDIKAWKDNAAHRMAQSRAKDWYKTFRVRVARVPFIGTIIAGVVCLCVSCYPGQEPTTQPRAEAETERVSESCDFSQYRPLTGDIDSHPNPADEIATPTYPDEARDAGIEGVVTLKLLVNGSGSVERVCVQDGDPRLVQSSVDAARKSKFIPLVINQRYRPYVVRTIRFNYVLPAKAAPDVH